jgi:hypothetical protein
METHRWRNANQGFGEFFGKVLGQLRLVEAFRVGRLVAEMACPVAGVCLQNRGGMCLAGQWKEKCRCAG